MCVHVRCSRNVHALWRRARKNTDGWSREVALFEMEMKGGTHLGVFETFVKCVYVCVGWGGSQRPTVRCVCMCVESVGSWGWRKKGWKKNKRKVLGGRNERAGEGRCSCRYNESKIIESWSYGEEGNSQSEKKLNGETDVWKGRWMPHLHGQREEDT